IVVLLMHDLCQKVASRWVYTAKRRCDEIILSPHETTPVEPGQEFHWIRGFLLSQNVDKCAMSQWLPLMSWFIIISPSTPKQKPKKKKKKRQLSFFQLQMLILN
uniref:Uncharacterized protein n=1 Tax=Piliocolobus tephrosceles TaxID=591936 RepID=A0A8C9HXX8_9PRIM